MNYRRFKWKRDVFKSNLEKNKEERTYEGEVDKFEPNVMEILKSYFVGNSAIKERQIPADVHRSFLFFLWIVDCLTAFFLLLFFETISCEIIIHILDKRKQ